MRPFALVLGLVGLVLAAASPAAWELREGVPYVLQPFEDACEKLEALKAAAPEDAQAAFYAGAAMEFGHCGPADLAAAISFYEHAARMQKGEAMIRLGVIQLHGRAGDGDLLRADFEFRSAAMLLFHEDSPVIHVMMAEMHRQATGEELDLSEYKAALEAFGLPVAGPPGEANFTNSVLYLEPGDMRALSAMRGAFAWSKAIAEGPASLKHLWAMRLWRGEGIRRLPQKANSLLLAASQQNPSDLQIAYDRAHSTIQGLGDWDNPGRAETASQQARRIKEGIFQLTRLAEQGYAPAQLDIGLWMAHGLNGLKRDPASAYPWLLLAQEGGMPIEGLVKQVGATLSASTLADTEAFYMPRRRGGWPLMAEPDAR